jgi:hypothetical protein
MSGSFEGIRSDDEESTWRSMNPKRGTAAGEVNYRTDDACPHVEQSLEVEVSKDGSPFADESNESNDRGGSS